MNAALALSGRTCFYLCDPEKNVNCKKKFCYKNGGRCRWTMIEEYSKDGYVPLSDEDDIEDREE